MQFVMNVHWPIRIGFISHPMRTNRYSFQIHDPLEPEMNRKSKELVPEPGHFELRLFLEDLPDLKASALR